MFPLEHGRALAEEIPGARLLVLEKAGHGVERADWQTIAREILEHTAPPGLRCGELTDVSRAGAKGLRALVNRSACEFTERSSHVGDGEKLVQNEPRARPLRAP